MGTTYDKATIYKLKEEEEDEEKHNYMCNRQHNQKTVEVR
jgi:hypothetical protein